MKTKILSLDDITWNLEVREDDLPVAGNCMASGDDDFDETCERRIIRRLNEGDVWAWCVVRVSGDYRGLSAEEYLGACSYKDEADFKRDGYYDDMRNEVLRRIQEKVSAVVSVSP